MKAETRSAIKVASGTMLLLGLVFGFIERRYAPSAMLTENSAILPSWVGWAGWILSGVATVAYILVDVLEWWGRRRFTGLQSRPIFTLWAERIHRAGIQSASAGY
jgi:hypothetical protein